MNYLSRASILGAKVQCPTGLRIGYITDLTAKERKEVETVINYWLDATAITEGEGSERTLIWNTENDTVEVYTDFSKGNFDGNLLHHDAIGDGDNDFQIGLLKILSFGHTPKTEKGIAIPQPTYFPFYIQFIYDDVVKKAEKALREEYRKLLVKTCFDEQKFISDVIASIKKLERTLTSRYVANNLLLENLIDADY